MVADILDGLRAAHGGCRIAAYADLTARMVLVTSADTPPRREVLDALCARAAALLAVPPLRDPAACDVAVSLAGAGDDLAVFLRLPTEPGDALCCLCDAAIDLDTFLPAARACLVQLSGPAPQPQDEVQDADPQDAAQATDSPETDAPADTPADRSPADAATGTDP